MAAQPQQQQLIDRLAADCPAIRNAAASDFEKVNAVREWGYTQIPRAANTDALLETTLGPEVYWEPFETLLRRFENMEGGCYCGGTSEALATLYRMLGYDAHTYNMGSPDGSVSHAVTLVQIRDGSRTLLSVQDAYFNYTLTRHTRPLGFDALLQGLAAGDLSGVVVQNGLADAKPMLAKEATMGAMRELYARYFRLGPVLETKNGMTRFSHDMSLKPFLPLFEEWLAKKNQRREWLYLFLFPTDLSDPRTRALVEQTRVDISAPAGGL